MVKIPKVGVTPNPKKEPRTPEDKVNAESKHPIWRLYLLDIDGPWGWRHDAETICEIVKGLASLETMTWAEIGKKRNTHFITHGLCKKAWARLEALNLDDAADLLYSIGLGNKPRLFGIRKGREFCALWWDPNHEVCPSEKKS